MVLPLAAALPIVSGALSLAGGIAGIFTGEASKRLRTAQSKAQQLVLRSKADATLKIAQSNRQFGMALLDAQEQNFHATLDEKQRQGRQQLQQDLSQLKISTSRSGFANAGTITGKQVAATINGNYALATDKYLATTQFSMERARVENAFNSQTIDAMQRSNDYLQQADQTEISSNIENLNTTMAEITNFIGATGNAIDSIGKGASNIPAVAKKG